MSFNHGTCGATSGGAPSVEPALSAPSGLCVERLPHQDGERLVVLHWSLPSTPPLSDLSPAERHVTALLLLGLSNAEIGLRRGRSSRTIANQLASIFRKMGVGSRAELVARCTARGENALAEP